jgi:dTDP-4-amino-4,6-dideoxygalactose transaminase
LPSDANASGRSFGAEELEELRQVLESGTLNCTRGRAVPALERAFAERLGVEHARAVTSGTAAVHTAVAAIGLEPGDEVITSPITDMGAIAPILYQAGIPVFADVDPDTMNMTADTIRAVRTRRTRAVIVTHLFGDPCDMDPIVEYCREEGLLLIEDAAQAFMAEYKGRLVGTMGDIGCFSFQQGKHMTTGEGGIVVTSDDALARHMRLFSDKAWGYGDPQPDHYFLALNYRMTELQGAVGLAQFAKLDANIAHRIAMVQRLGDALAGAPGISMPVASPHRKHVYWRIGLRVDEHVLPGGAVAYGQRLRDLGVACAPRYIVKPAFECEVLRDQRTFGNSGFPFVGEHRKDDPAVVYDRAHTPGAVRGLNQVVVLPINERFGAAHVDALAAALLECANELTAGSAQPS